VELEQRLTQAATDEFVSRGRLRLVGGPTEADVFVPLHSHVKVAQSEEHDRMIGSELADNVQVPQGVGVLSFLGEEHGEIDARFHRLLFFHRSL
jgi:hypothetical protein